MKFTEAKLEEAIIELLGEQGYPHLNGGELTRNNHDVLIKDDLRAFLALRYQDAGITQSEIETVIRQLETLPASDLYDSNKTFCKWLSDGFPLKREAGAKVGSASQKDLYIQLLDFENVSEAVRQSLLIEPQIELDMAAENSANYSANTDKGDSNIYRMVNQLEIEGGTGEKRIPDGIIYINGLPLVVFEFKSSIRTKATIHEAFVQLTTRYRRDIPQLFVFNALCVISDGVNNKMGNLFAPYQFFYSWGKVTGNELVAEDGINSLHTMLQWLFDKARLRDVMRHFIYFPDSGKKEIKIVPRYPQYYAAKNSLKISNAIANPLVTVKEVPTLGRLVVVKVSRCSFYRAY